MDICFGILPKEVVMSKNRSVFICGCALFSMFFGAGNLVFPLKVGQSTGNFWMFGALGLAITGIILPFFGLFAVKLHKGDYYSFFGEAGGFVKTCLPFLILSLIAPFGGAPRCITVAYGGMNCAPEEFSLFAFSALFCVSIFFVSIKDQRLIDVVGKWMTPVLLLALVILIGLGLCHCNEMEGKLNYNAMEAVSDGFVTGYQTMDLLAAFFFSSLIFSQVKKMVPEKTSEKEVLAIAVKSGVLASVLLMTVYMGMIFLGANFASVVKGVNPSFMLSAIAKHLMGANAKLFIGITVLVACFTTVVALHNIYAQSLCQLFKLGEDKFKFVLLGSIVTSFFVSLFDFSGIANFIVPILDVSYPSLIALTISSVFIKERYGLKKIMFYGVLVVTLLTKFI
jgi:LIVCS family branched-chain amino acid:cation transporter